MPEPTKNIENRLLRVRYAELVLLRQIVAQLESRRESPRKLRRLAETSRVRSRQGIRSIEIAPQD